MVTTILSWALTYALHSTILIGSIWLLCRAIPRLSLAMQESLWKLALVGAIATASLQQGAGLAPPWGHLGLPAALQVDAPTKAAAASTATAQPVAVHHRAGELTIVATRQGAPAAASVAAAPAPDRSAWPYVLLSAMVAGALFGLVRVVVAAVRLRKQLAGRRDVIEDPLLESWLALCAKAELPKRVRLSASPSLSSPVALARREVCIPERAIEGLTPQQQESMLAHELAHVVRRDAWWLHASALIEALLFFQPLNHLARRKLEEVSEYQCDDWAARRTGTGVHLAKCLAEVAAWVDREPAGGVAAPAMASVRSPIVRRIRRLLDLDPNRVREAETRPAWRAGAGLALLGGVAWLAPGVEPRAEAATRTANASAAPARIEVEDVDDRGGHDRARVRIVGGDETVEVHVAAPRNPPPPAPPVPAPPAREPSGDVSIIIQGGWMFEGWPLFGPGHGYIGIDIDGLGTLEALLEDDPFEASIERLELELERDAELLEASIERELEARERAAERAEEAYEQWREAEDARREAEDARREAEDARASWGRATSGGFGPAAREAAPAAEPLVSL
ncbi:MAG: M56 family metallopeptidase [Nannocystaceae bacterium]|nr:M56 family metallopeptidase [Nannocystaceae bacterium]